MSENVLIVEKEEGIATFTLNRPEAMNALSRGLRRALATAFADAQSDSEVRVVILTGAGRAFCAGLDLKELSSGDLESESGSFEENLMDAIAGFEGPVIGAINGHAITGGLELALACDILVASTEARFADTHARVGMLPGWGLSQKLPRLIGLSRAKELCFTGNYVTAHEAERWGLVNRVVQPEELLSTCRSLAKDILSCDPEVLPRYKRLINEGFGMPFSDAMAFESETARRYSERITADLIAQRRKGIVQRGRQQGKR